MNFRRGYLALLAVPVLAIGLAACGGSSSNDSNTSNAASSSATPVSSTSDTVSTKSVSGVGTVLVDSKGDALYTNNQDTASKMACTASCQSIWPPLMASGQPTSSDSAVQAKLGMANGQVTFDGKPLYTFVQDSPGQATGDGFMDSFDGTSFTWTAATAAGSSASGSSAGASGGSTAPAPAPASSSSGGSSGGYSY
jgi:predicted lipoprotein with Yx(FWY)xxD motif